MKLFDLAKSIRAFNPKKELENKILKINEFFSDEGLDAAVLGLSGGVDSALVASLLVEAANRKDSPIKRIRFLIIPIVCSGSTSQSLATRQALTVVGSFNRSGLWDSLVCDLTSTFDELINNSNCHKVKSNWADGQLVSVLRTPVLYYHAALLQAENFKSIVVGTTNFDEGSYIGFYGKASDGMVDLQPISDLHKHEVKELAKLLKVPKEVIDAEPRGDTYDGRIDEEMIGAPYWFLSSYLIFKECHANWPPAKIQKLKKEIKKASGKKYLEYLKYSLNIEKLHRKNLHKYSVGSPARYLSDRKINPNLSINLW